MNLQSDAIKAALNNNWEEAIKKNLEILKNNPCDIEALNRLAQAYKKTGKTRLSEKIYKKVVSLDPLNPIALKNLEILASSKSKNQHLKKIKKIKNSLSSFDFIEEPGKTKVVNLVNLAPPATLMTVSCGEEVSLCIRRRTVVFLNCHGNYLGALPDDLSARLIKFIKGGNQYQAFIKTVTKKTLSVLLKEFFRAKKFRNQPTFPCISQKDNTSYQEKEKPSSEVQSEFLQEESSPLFE